MCTDHSRGRLDTIAATTFEAKTSNDVDRETQRCTRPSDRIPQLGNAMTAFAESTLVGIQGKANGIRVPLYLPEQCVQLLQRSVHNDSVTSSDFFFCTGNRYPFSAALDA